MKILVINPGSTSTKIAVFNGRESIFIESIHHPTDILSQFNSLKEQKDFRKEKILEVLEKYNISLDQLEVVIGRGGILKPIEAGTYRVNDALINDLIQSKVEHASNLGGIIAYEIAADLEVPAYIADPVSVDEFEEVARISGLKEINRLNIIVAHLGGGISIAPLRNGKIVDVNNANEGGPFSPERTGILPSIDVVRMSYSGKYEKNELVRLFTKKGGLVSYLGVNSMPEVMEKIRKGDKYAKLIVDAMCYQIAKEIGAMATVLKGNVEAIIFTGGLSHNKELIAELSKRVSWIAPIVVYPGEEEMSALAMAAFRVLKGEEKEREYI
jgi:butyrate kinase